MRQQLLQPMDQQTPDQQHQLQYPPTYTQAHQRQQQQQDQTTHQHQFNPIPIHHDLSQPLPTQDPNAHRLSQLKHQRLEQQIEQLQNQVEEMEFHKLAKEVEELENKVQLLRNPDPSTSLREQGKGAQRAKPGKETKASKTLHSEAKLDSSEVRA